MILLSQFGLKIFLMILEREEEGEKHRCKKHPLAAPCTPPTGNQARNPGMCPDLEWNQQPFGAWDDTQPTEPQWPEINIF